jgi:hypothetical protein
VCVDVMYSGEYNVCGVTLSVHPHCQTTVGIIIFTYIHKKYITPTHTKSIISWNTLISKDPADSRSSEISPTRTDLKFYFFKYRPIQK